jgi:hypothetical protein
MKVGKHGKEESELKQKKSSHIKLSPPPMPKLLDSVA